MNTKPNTLSPANDDQVGTTRHLPFCQLRSRRVIHTTPWPPVLVDLNLGLLHKAAFVTTIVVLNRVRGSCMQYICGFPTGIRTKHRPPESRAGGVKREARLRLR